MDAIPDLIETTVRCLLSNKLDQARTSLAVIDFPALINLRAELRDTIWARGGLATGYKSPRAGMRRQCTRQADIRATFERDRYTCRYLHCRRKTIAPAVLRLISKAFPDLVGCHPNWYPIETHILYWVYGTSIEHLVPFPAGGTSNPENLLTACYMCNDAKNRVPHTVLGWDVAPPSESPWFGLSEYVAELRKVVRL